METEKLEDIFLKVLIPNIDDLRSGKLPKGKFIGKYTQELRAIDKNNAHHFVHPQVAGHGKEPNNNWIDYMMSLTDEEFEYFKQAIT